MSTTEHNYAELAKQASELASELNVLRSRVDHVLDQAVQVSRERAALAHQRADLAAQKSEQAFSAAESARQAIIEANVALEPAVKAMTSIERRLIGSIDSQDPGVIEQVRRLTEKVNAAVSKDIPALIRRVDALYARMYLVIGGAAVALYALNRAWEYLVK